MLSECIDAAALRVLAAGNESRQLRLDSTNLARNFKRLVGLVVGDRGRSGESSPSLAIDIRFEEGSEGYPCVHLALDGRLDLECQRCLRPFGFPVKLQTQLTILSADMQTSQIAEPFDSVIMTPEGFNLAAVIEDEILSALPMAPVHSSAAECVVQGGGLDETKTAAEKPNRPFADLPSLMDAVGKDRLD